MEVKQRTVGGRPRGFDKDAALDAAMRLFWRHGYDGVSIEQLTAAMAITPPSLYAAFGNKAALYRAALQRYDPLDLAILLDAPTLIAGVRDLLKRAVDTITNPGRERGCMISSGLIAVHPASHELADETAHRRALMREGMADAFRRWLDPASAAVLARYLSAVLTGLSVQARDGLSRAELLDVAERAAAAVAYPTGSAHDGEPL